MQREAYRRVGLRDIAEATDLSVATVSRVLAEKTPERFSPKTRDLVQKVAKELNYRPNLLATAARGGPSKTIGVFLPPYDRFWTDVIYGVHDHLLTDDHVPLILWPVEIQGHRAAPGADGEHRHVDELSQLHRMIDRAVDGLIVWPVVQPEAREYLECLVRDGLPTIGIDHMPVEDRFALSVGTDEAAGAEMVASHLHELGHRAAVHLAGPPNLSWSEQRGRYFHQCFDAATDAWSVSLPERDPAQTQTALKGMLGAGRQVTAVYCATDELARVAVEAIDAVGLRLGSDVSVVSVGDTDFAQGARITSLRQKPYEIGMTAARLVLEAQRGAGPPATREHTLQPELIVRDSTKEVRHA